jgi:hypothetical protein
MASTATGISFTTDTMMTPMSGCFSLTWRSTCSPEIPGSWTSSSMTSTGECRMISRASSPVPAVMEFIPADLTMASIVCRRAGSSSTMRTLALLDIASGV